MTESNNELPSDSSNATPSFLTDTGGVQTWKKSKASRKHSHLPWLGLVIGLFVLLTWIYSTISHERNVAKRLEDARQKELNAAYPVETIPTPNFPDLGEYEILEESGIRTSFVKLKGNGPGQEMSIRVYLPKLIYAERSLPCVITAPSGTSLMTGANVNQDDHDENLLRYVHAQIAVVYYSLDGATDELHGSRPFLDEKAHQKFESAFSGVVNGRNAVEFVLAKLPEVNPKRIFAVGHSSAGTLSLLLASHLPQLAGVVAYAPCCDVERRGSVGPQDRLATFFKRSSPLTHVSRTSCPIFLFHAFDDKNVHFIESVDYAEKVKATGMSIELSNVPTGGHFQAYVNEGIPEGIEWISKH